jgi:hypothetical protein
MAHRTLPHREEFLISIDDEASWEAQDDALSAGVHIAAFEQRPTHEVEAEFERFRKDL